jgi:isoquinoline 1-oxidoreductase beta subunit
MRATRREFLRITALAGGALAIGVTSGHSADQKAPFRPNIWLQIDPDGSVVITMAKAEMGQGVRTSLPMIVADELDADLSRVRLVQAVTGPDFKRISTGGSWSVGGSWRPLRQAGAAAREMLVLAAAARLAVDRTTLRTERGFVVNDRTGKRIGYGELTADAAKVEVPKEPRLKSPKDFRLIGTRTKRLDGRDIVTGAAKYGIDTRVPGMRFATIERPPVIGGSVVSFDGTKAKRVRGVRDVVATSAGVAVVADSTWAALKGREQLEVKWNEGPNAQFDSRAFIDAMVQRSFGDAVVMRKEGDVATAIESAAKKVEAIYVYPFYAHAPVETMNAIAHFHDGKCEIWAPTQAATRAQELTAAKLGIAPENATVHTTLIGGGFGRRLGADYAVEAAELSRAIGAPVQVLWTRADDMKQGHLQHASVHRMRGGVDAQGNVVGWSHVKLSNPIMSIFPPPSAEEMRDLATFYQDSAWGVYDVPYAIPNLETSYVRVDSPVKYGPWRAVYAPASIFARESFVDELAHAARRDPLQFRLDLLNGDEPVKAGGHMLLRARLRHVLEVVRDRSSWGKPLGEGRGQGVAVNMYEGETSVAYVVEVSSRNGVLHVDRVVAAVDPGPVINPIGIEQQVEGGIIWALGQLQSEITIRNGRVEQSNFADYTVPRITDTPAIEIHIVPTDGPQPFGIGEPPVPPFAPAVLNAWFAATGKRVRRLPV